MSLSKRRNSSCDHFASADFDLFEKAEKNTTLANCKGFFGLQNLMLRPRLRFLSPRLRFRFRKREKEKSFIQPQSKSHFLILPLTFFFSRMWGPGENSEMTGREKKGPSFLIFWSCSGPLSQRRRNSAVYANSGRLLKRRRRRRRRRWRPLPHFPNTMGRERRRGAVKRGRREGGGRTMPTEAKGDWRAAAVEAAAVR